MRLDLPPLTLGGGRVLHGGVLRDGALGVASGRIVSAGPPAVDVTGYAVLPGAVDLGGQVRSDLLPDHALGELANGAAMAGTTTLFVERALTGLDASEEMSLSGNDLGQGWPDILMRVVVGSHDIEMTDQQLTLVDGQRPAAVTFVHPSEEDRRQSEDRVGGFGTIARRLASVASALDAQHIRYGSDGDVTAETREWMSMIGARMVLRPATRQAAATARAMGEPVILSASDVLTGGTVRRGMAAAILGEGMCDSLGSFGAADAALRAVTALVSSGRMSLGHAWALISSAPAGIMGLSDRGGLVDGTRADIVLMETASLKVSATISAGRLIHADAEIVSRLEDVFSPDTLAAE